MNKLKLYLIDFPINFVKDAIHKLHMNILDSFRKCIYKYEIECRLNYKICDPYYGTPVSDIKVGIFSPVLIVTKTLEKYFGFGKYYRLQIHGIDVDTQNEDIVYVTIRLQYPGILIGRAGKDINAVEKLLTANFGKETKIKIDEVRKDINEPLYDF